VSEASLAERVQRPAHVPAEAVVDFDFFQPAGMADGEDVYTALKRLHAGPDIQWTPRNGGHWILTRSEDVRWARQEAMLCSHEEFLIPRGSYGRLMPPTNVDPPVHARFRAQLNPGFRPVVVRELKEKARAIAVDLIEQLKPRGRCDFVADFGRVMPVIMFLDLCKLPTERRGEFVGWVMSYMNEPDPARKDAAAGVVAAFLAEVIDQRAAHPGEDLLSQIAAWRKHPLYQSEDEVIGMALTVFFGGLDTVTNMMAFTARHLASHPEARRRLIDDPDLIPHAAEEYFRRHGLTNTARLMKDDATRKGVTFKKGELLLVMDTLAGVDERAWPNPMEIDFDRDSSVHDTFGNGVHKCVGEHLARMEQIVFLEEWLRRIPEFRLDPDLPGKTYSGPVIGMSQLGLRWD
jgi:cytochrome P450